MLRYPPYRIYLFIIASFQINDLSEPRIPDTRVPPAYPDNDPLSVSQVNGYYGPGAWAAWLIALASSAHAMYSHGDETSTLVTTIPPVLYINWAAIDILHRLMTNNISYGTMASAIAISYWGLLVLIIFSLMLAMNDSSSPRPEIRGRIQAMILAGSILPVIALLSAMCKGPQALSNIDNDYQQYLARQWEGCYHNLAFYYSIWSLFVGAAFGTTIWDSHDPVPTIMPERSRISDNRTFRNAWVILLTIGATVAMSCILLPFTELVVRWGPTGYVAGTCTFKPCAPQSILEWDQAFSLLCGVVLFVYEVGPGMWMVVKRSVMYIYAKIGSRSRDSF